MTNPTCMTLVICFGASVNFLQYALRVRVVIFLSWIRGRWSSCHAWPEVRKRKRNRKEQTRLGSGRCGMILIENGQLERIRGH
jgi:hypothetical protein